MSLGEIVQEYVLYPTVATFVPGRFQPAAFKYLSGNITYSKNYPAEAADTPSTNEPHLFPELLDESLDWNDVAVTHSRRSAVWEIASSIALLFAATTYAVVSDNNFALLALPVGFVTALDGALRDGQAGMGRPSNIGAGYVNSVSIQRHNPPRSEGFSGKSL